MRLALLCATSVILKIIELANCTRSQAVIDEGFGFLSPSCSSQQNVAPVSYRLEVNYRKLGSKEQDSSWQRHSSKINPLGDPQCGIFGRNVLSSSPCGSCDKIYIILLAEGQFCHGDPHKERGSAVIYTKISFISLR